MSLILDALNRSRQEENPVPGLGSYHPVEPEPTNWRQYSVWVALAVALLVIAWLVIDRFGTRPDPAADIGAPVAELSNNFGSAVSSVTAELKARAAAAAPPAAVSQSQAAPQTPSAQAGVVAPVPVAAERPVQSPMPAAITQAATTPIAPAPEPAQEATDALAASPVAPAVPAAEDPAVARLYQNRELQEDPVMPAQRAPADRQSADSADIDQILQQAREEMENASLEEHPVPFLADLSQQTKDGIPTIYYQRHDYSSNTKVSSVVLNGTPYKVGGNPLPGMQVEEILPDSVVLSYRGTQFRLRALNSWVNL